MALTQQTKSKNNAADDDAWSAERLLLLLTSNIEEVQTEHFEFYGCLRLELNFVKGSIKSVAVERRQTLIS